MRARTWLIQVRKGPVIASSSLGVTREQRDKEVPDRRAVAILLGLATAFASCSLSVSAKADDSAFGGVSDVQSSIAGLYIHPLTLPANCSTTAGGWLLVAPTDQTMIAHFLLLEALARPMRIYTNGQKDSSGYCFITNIAEH